MDTEDSKLEKLTLTIPGNVVRDAKFKALERNTSISAEVTKFLKEWNKHPVSVVQASITTDPQETYTPTDK
jgi:hypothetical protein